MLGQMKKIDSKDDIQSIKIEGKKEDNKYPETSYLMSPITEPSYLEGKNKYTADKKDSPREIIKPPIFN